MLALAVGIGASVALLHCFLSALRPALPFRDPQRLVVLWSRSKKDPSYNEMLTSAGELSDWRVRSRSFRAVAASSWTENRNFGSSGLPERVRSFRVTPSLFEVLGVQPQYGRAFSENERTGDLVAILGHAFCATHFTSPEAALSGTIRLDGEPYRIVGVLPPDFAIGFMTKPDVLIPISLNAADLDRADRSLFGLARLRDGISVSGAREEMAAVAESVAREHPEHAGWTADLNLLVEKAPRMPGTIALFRGPGGRRSTVGLREFRGALTGQVPDTAAGNEHAQRIGRWLRPAGTTSSVRELAGVDSGRRHRIRDRPGRNFFGAPLPALLFELPDIGDSRCANLRSVPAADWRSGAVIRRGSGAPGFEVRGVPATGWRQPQGRCRPRTLAVLGHDFPSWSGGGRSCVTGFMICMLAQSPVWTSASTPTIRWREK